MDVIFGCLILLNMAPPQKLAPSAIFRGNMGHWPKIKCCSLGTSTPSSFGIYVCSVSVKSDAQNFEELIHLDNQPVTKATEDLLNSNPVEAGAPPTSPLHAFEDNTITQDNITTQQGKAFLFHLLDYISRRTLILGNQKKKKKNQLTT